MTSVKISLKSTHDWSSVANAQALVDALVAAGDYWVPEKLDRKEPERFAFDTQDLQQLIELWTSEVRWVFLKRRKPYPVSLVIRMFAREDQKFNELTGGVDERYFKDQTNVERLLVGARHLYDWGGATHAFLAHDQDWNDKNYLGAPTRLGSGKITSTGGLWLEDGLPGIYWANFFGPVYVKFFGVDKFRTVPAFHKEELKDGGYLLLAAESPLDYARPEVRALERKIIDHLGRDAFFDRSRPGARTRAPQFEFQQAASSQPRQELALDPVTLVIPDAAQFIADVPKLAEALGRRMRTTLDYTPNSLDRLDNFIVRRSKDEQEPWTKAEARQLLQEATAYYGEVLRRNVDGRWLVAQGSAGDVHPAIALPRHLSDSAEYPFTRVLRIWLDRAYEDGLASRYFALTSGKMRPVERFLKNLGIGH